MPPEPSPLIAWLLAYKYAIAYPLAVVEGPVVMLASGFLVHLGLIPFVPMYLVLMAGDLTGDAIWYAVGRHGARTLIEKYGHFLDITEENVERAERFFNSHQGKILFISKLTTGFGFAIATLIAAGAVRVPFKKYIVINFLGEFIWAGLLMGAGYLLGNLYTLVDEGLRQVFIVAMIVLGILATYGFSRFMRKKFAKSL